MTHFLEGSSAVSLERLSGKFYKQVSTFYFIHSWVWHFYLPWKKAFIIQTAPFGFFKDMWELRMEHSWFKSWPKKRGCCCLGTKEPRTFSMFWANKGTGWPMKCVEGLRGTTPQYRTWLLTRATFLCGFSSFGLWKVAAMGAVDVHREFSLQLLPGFLMPTDPEHCGHTLWRFLDPSLAPWKNSSFWSRYSWVPADGAAILP